MNDINGQTKIPVGISSCLLGQLVRFNGGHSQSRFCLNILSEFFDFRAHCPEVAAGFGVPRPTMRLTGNPDHPDLVFTDDTDAVDYSERLIASSSNMINAASQLDGYILMKNSPSCGLERVKVYQENGHPHEQRAAGVFTSALKKAHPNLPVEEDGRLNDPRLRENFIARVYAHHYFRSEVKTQRTPHALVQYHSKYKYFVMAHSQVAYRELGRLVASSRRDNIEELIPLYFEQFMAAVANPATRRGHCNALQHIFGYLKRYFPGHVRRDILNVIDQYRSSEVNLETPMTLLCHYLNQIDNNYIKQQRYLLPYPHKLGLRNAI